MGLNGLLVGVNLEELWMENEHDTSANTLVDALAKILERRRQRLGMSQEELSKKAGLSRTYLSDIERGLRNISVLTLAKLAAAMGSEASEMLSEAESMTRSTVGVVSK